MSEVGGLILSEDFVMDMHQASSKGFRRGMRGSEDCALSFFLKRCEKYVSL